MGLGVGVGLGDGVGVGRGVGVGFGVGVGAGVGVAEGNAVGVGTAVRAISTRISMISLISSVVGPHATSTSMLAVASSKALGHK